MRNSARADCQRCSCFGFVLVVWLLPPAALEAATPSTPQAAAAIFFEKEVRPLLAERCFKCHGENKQSGELRLDSRASILAGGDSGPAIVPGKPGESLLVEAIRYESLEMPPKGKLSDAQVAILTRWVQLGAPWPGELSPGNGGRPARPQDKITDEDRRWWAFQPVRNVTPPPAADSWIRNDLDRFIFDKLRHAGLTPAPEASRAVLIRRAFFDLWGLPPSPEQVDAFVHDPAADAYERLIDRLLDAPQYGQRSARHWLDLVRYADSDGYRIDDYRPLAWRYRDYVIAAFNADKPYDRFVQDQLAGDELFPGDPDALVATGYLRHWIYEYNSRDVRGQWQIILNDITDTTGDVFLGLGLQCARCHDHKFDPLLQRDYFRLQAFFAPLLPRDDLVAASAQQQAARARQAAAWEAQTADLRRQLAELEAPYRLKATEDAITKFPADIQAMLRKPVAERLPLEQQLAELAYRQVTYEFGRLDRKFKGERKEQILALRRKLAQFDKLRPPPLPLAICVTDVGPLAPDLSIPKKGNTPIEPGFVTILDPEPARIEPLPAAPNSTGRRAALARWLTQPQNPLTGRVIVNRVWQDHFGHGLAANASDFGRLGEPPSHPELLDWLAAKFIRDGWSFKRLHKLILTSATYRQSADHPAPRVAQLRDPDNRLLWRGGVRRLEAEQIRDALFAASGELDLTAGGPGVPGDQPRRAIYCRIMRNTRDPLLDVFDAPYWFNSASSRDTTTTPVQSLLLVNSQWMLHRAQAFARRLRREEPSNRQRIVERAYQLAFGRAPTAGELRAAEQFLDAQLRRIRPETAGSAQAKFMVGKIPYRDGQAAVCDPDGPQRAFQVPPAEPLPPGDFTVEAFVLPRSIYPTGEVRTIAATWDGNSRRAGWLFGITGKGSRRKPQTLVLQVYGDKLGGTFGEEAIFSDQHIQLDKPYYLAAAVRLAAEGPGSVTFYVKDLSNDDEPLLVAKVPHAITGGLSGRQSLGIGSRSLAHRGFFDGLIDDVRLSDAALGVDQLLFTNEATNRHTLGYWQFEPKPGVFEDSSGHALQILPAETAGPAQVNLDEAALTDFCHALLNASEFLYVE
ncbi:MAG TPA: DUF1553 domain-containing protein [Pirellulales bacterium]